MTTKQKSTIRYAYIIVMRKYTQTHTANDGMDDGVDDDGNGGWPIQHEAHPGDVRWCFGWATNDNKT